MNYLKYRVFFTLLYISTWGISAPTDSIEVSLMTCAPGKEVYSLYGHTAIRYNNYTSGEDWVFNYGLFDFSKPNFIWRFTKGECDYQIGALPYMYFKKEYEARGSDVVQQKINLTSEEKQRLWSILTVNMRPENRVYRYNFLYDNCTTRARDRIEECIGGEVIYPESDTLHTYREIIHQYTKGHPWAELGNDICLGSEADLKVTERQEMFAPFYMLHYADGAMIRDTLGRMRPLVVSKELVVQGKKSEANSFRWGMPSPQWCAWMLFLGVLLCCGIEQKYNKMFWGIDLLLMTLQGGIGIVVTFLFFFSSHPTVGSNWQIWVFNPLPLMAMPWVVYCAIKRRKTSYHLYNTAVLMIFILFSRVIPQDFCMVVVPLALTLLLHSCSYLLTYRKISKKTDLHYAS